MTKQERNEWGKYQNGFAVKHVKEWDLGTSIFREYLGILHICLLKILCVRTCTQAWPNGLSTEVSGQRQTTLGLG